MVLKKENMSTVVRSRLKGGRGDISFLNFADCTNFRNCRLLSEMTLPVGASIGEHTHENESEYYIISEGTGLAVDNGVEKTVEKGDVVVTNHGESHKLVNTGDVPLKAIAIIVTYQQ